MKKHFCIGIVYVFLLATISGTVQAQMNADTVHAHPNIPYSAPESISEGVSSERILQQFNSSWLKDSLTEGVFMKDLRIWGNMRFLTIYRNMDEFYPDMLTNEKNVSFLDYPLINGGTSNNGGVPMLELTMESNLSKNISFVMGYSYAHNFRGEDDPVLDRAASARSNIMFGGEYTANAFKIGINAGHVLWTRISKFTMGQAIYRDNYFDRLPWDWHRNSFDRYKEYYDFTGNIGPEGFGRSPVQGLVVDAMIKPLKLAVKGVYGRTNRNTIQANASNHFPSITTVLRLQRGLIISGNLNGTIGLNAYQRMAEINRYSDQKDDVRLFTTDLDFMSRDYHLKAEVGYGLINNPIVENGSGLGVDITLDIDKEGFPVPITLEYYNIHNNVVSLDGSIINSNLSVRDGGYPNEINWDNMLIMNVVQEVDQVANNRWGGILKTKKEFGSFKVELGIAASQEKENLYDTITLQHRVNAFSRSRFRPWYQAGGPYSRIKSSWLRTFEIFQITDEANGISTDYKKGFNNIELLLKYQVSLFGKQLILLNFNTYNSIQDNFSPIPVFSDKAFVRSWYSDITLAYALGKKYMVVGHFGNEQVWGNDRINLSPNNGEVINQSGQSFAIGIDYDFIKNAGIHIRHKWMVHKDENFALDRFKGQETTFELKIFF